MTVVALSRNVLQRPDGASYAETGVSRAGDDSSAKSAIERPDAA